MHAENRWLGKDAFLVYCSRVGETPLLTPEGEVDASRRIERAELAVAVGLLRSRLAIRNLVRIGDDVRSGKIQKRETTRSSTKADHLVRQAFAAIAELNRSDRRRRAERLAKAEQALAALR